MQGWRRWCLWEEFDQESRSKRIRSRTVPVPSAGRASGTRLSDRGLSLVGVWAGSSPPAILPYLRRPGGAASCKNVKQAGRKSACLMNSWVKVNKTLFWHFLFMHFFCLNQEICFFLCKCFDGLERGVAATETKPASDSLESSLQTFKSWELTFSPPLEEPLTESKLNDVFKLWLISVSELLCKHFLLINQTSSRRSGRHRVDDTGCTSMTQGQQF